MHPVIFRIPGIGWEVPGYGLALMVGFLASIMWAVRRAERSGGNPDVILNAGFLALFGGVIGARAMYVVHYWYEFANRGSLGRMIWGIVDVRQGGLEVYGGFITVVILVLLYLWLSKNSIRWYLDIIAPSAALGMAVGRIGCFLNGCCWGGLAELPWSMRFPFGSPPSVDQWQKHDPGAGIPQQLIVFGEGTYSNGTVATPLPRESLRLSDREIAAARNYVELKHQIARTFDLQQRQKLEQEKKKLPEPDPRAVAMQEQMVKYGMTADQLRQLARDYPSQWVHPAQLYSTLNLGLLALLLSILYWRRTRDGQVILTLLLIEPWTRWLLELVRADNPIDVGGTLTISQFLGICLSVAGLIGLFALRRLPARSPLAVWWTPPPSEAEQKAVPAKRARAVK